jgi:hypothetical protein
MTKRCDCGCGQVVRLAPYSNKSRGWVKGKPIRFVHGHHRRIQKPEYVEEDRGYETPCWIWQRATLKPRGYGTAYRNGKSGLAHRIYYEEHVGPIPKGLHLDHLCEVPACVNPDHLEPVTCRENLRRGRSTRLNLEEVRELVQRRLAGEAATALGKEFGVDPSHVAAMSRGAEAIITS